MKKVKNTIPVYDIDHLGYKGNLQHDLVIQPFAEYLKIHPNLANPHRHSFYHMLLFTKGSGSHTIDFEQFAVKAGQVYFMIPGQVHSWNFSGQVDGYIINFSEQFFKGFLADDNYPEQFSFFRGIAKDSVIDLQQSIANKMAEQIKEMMEEKGTNNEHSRDMIGAMLVSLLINISRSVKNKVSKSIPQQNQLALYNFRKLVNEHYTEKHLPKDYAAMLYVTPNYLNGLCKDLLGKAAGEVIRDRILLEAKRLLVNAEIAIAEIAYQLNFKDNSYFTKFFKKYEGVTPEDFRRASLTN